MGSIFNKEYFDAVTAAVENGLIALCIALVAGVVFNIITGASAARNWKKNPQAH